MTLNTDFHKQAKWRTRRLIMNNDGDDGRVDPAPSIDGFLDRRTSALGESKVDSIFYCADAFTCGNPDLPPRDYDPIEEMVRWCRGHDREIFYSMRMNDQHDAGWERMMPWKEAHRDWLMNIKDGYPKWSWSMIDYSIEGVRDKVFESLESFASGYDVDGLELDFCSPFCLFRSQMKGEPVTQDERDLMTDLMRRVRTMTREIADRRGKPMLIALRLFDDVDYCREAGIDLGLWLEEGLVDLITSGDYFKLRPWSDWAALGKQYDLPVYACLEPRRFPLAGIKGQEIIEGEANLPCWRGEALSAWRAGVNGIYTFNRFDSRDPLFSELHDPELLERLEHVDIETFSGGVETHYFDPGFWIKGGRRFLKDDI